MGKEIKIAFHPTVVDYLDQLIFNVNNRYLIKYITNNHVSGHLIDYYK
jgi:hypothetical protein